MNSRLHAITCRDVAFNVHSKEVISKRNIWASDAGRPAHSYLDGNFLSKLARLTIWTGNSVSHLHKLPPVHHP